MVKIEHLDFQYLFIEILKQGAQIKVAIVALSDGILDIRPYRLSKILVELGYDVELIGYPTSEKFHDNARWKYTQFNSTMLPLKRVSMDKLLTILLSRRNIAAAKLLDATIPINIKEVISEINADFFVAMDYKILPFLAERARRLDSKLVYEAREYYQGQYANNFIWKMIFPRIIRNIEGKYIKDCDAIFTVSNGIANLLQENYELSSKPKVVLGFPETNIQSHVTLNLPIDLVFHGNIDKRRDLQYFISVMYPIFDYIKLDIRGKGSKKIINKILRAAKRRSISANLKILEPVKYEDLLSNTSKYHFGLIPWRNNISQVRFAMPNKFFEYLNAGIPVICSDNSEISETVQRFQLGLVFDHKNPLLLKDRISKLTETEYQSFKSSVSDYVNNFGFDKQKELIQKVFVELAN